MQLCPWRWWWRWWWCWCCWWKRRFRLINDFSFMQFQNLYEINFVFVFHYGFTPMWPDYSFWLLLNRKMQITIKNIQKLSTAGWLVEWQAARQRVVCVCNGNGKGKTKCQNATPASTSRRMYFTTNLNHKFTKLNKHLLHFILFFIMLLVLMLLLLTLLLQHFHFLWRTWIWNNW